MTNQETVAQITAQVASLEGFSPENQVLLLAGTPPEDETTWASVRWRFSTPEVVGCMLGGKAHGSLARARKARGQTPKVAKQEKKKETGRIERHMQYNQRSASVVPTLGKKKVPMPTLQSSVILAFSNKAA